MSGRWKAISPSQFPWEQDALDFIQRAMPNREPFRAYSNFEFVAEDGSINEVDLEGRPGIMKNSPKTTYSSELKSEF